MLKNHYTLQHNLIIKKPVPPIGIICSNPKRAERIVSQHLDNVVHLSEYKTAWSLDIYTGTFRDQSVFIAGVAVGAAGAAFAIQQLAVAGARWIIRYGSNDDPNLTEKRMREIILVHKADNLYGLMQSGGAAPDTWGHEILASVPLIQSLEKEAQRIGLSTLPAICHHIEDYAAYAFPQLVEEPYQSRIRQHISSLESKNTDYLHCRDMETAALYFRGQRDGFHAATVLQNVPKFAGSHQTYDGDQGELARQLEIQFGELILTSLVSLSHSNDLLK